MRVVYDVYAGCMMCVYDVYTGCILGVSVVYVGCMGCILNIRGLYESV